MIQRDDQEILQQMAGASFASNPSTAFVDEYETRLRMMHRVGVTGGLGAICLLHLLREFQIAPQESQKATAVNDWRSVPEGARIMHSDQSGDFMGIAGDGLVLISYDGQSLVIEVPSSEVLLKPPLVEGAADSEFVPSEADTKIQAEVLAAEAKVMEKWGSVEALTEVSVSIDGKKVKAEFVSISGTDLQLFMNDEEMLVPASSVQLLKKK